MLIHRGSAILPLPGNAIVTSGTFDGVHIGHRKILHRLREISRVNGGQTVVITYSPHPRIVLSQGTTDLKLLNTDEEKAELIAAQGIDYLLIIHFTPEFSQLSPEEYIQKIYLQGVGAKKLVIGYDHHFGKNREGNFDYLAAHQQRFGFSVEEIPRQEIEDVGVSSTKIRNALNEGNILIANQYLGSRYSLSGKVVHGDKIGRTLGFPTANIDLGNPYKLIPADGIYAVRVLLEKRTIEGMLYIGNRPTLNGQDKKRVEVNLFDFEEDIYEKEIRVFFVDKIRADEKFEDLHLMKAQLFRDGQLARAILKKGEK